MHASKILFPTDFSTLSDAALKHATVLAPTWGRSLSSSTSKSRRRRTGRARCITASRILIMPALHKMLDGGRARRSHRAVRASDDHGGPGR